MATFPGETGSAISLSCLPLVPEESLWGLVELSFLWAGCPSCHPVINIKALMGTQCTDPKQWLGLILSSSTIRLLNELVLLPLYLLCSVEIL